MKQILIFSFLYFLCAYVWANNIRVTNVSLINQDVTGDSYQVKFNIAWDNSWRTSTNESNWDAAWVFVKYRTSYNAEWKHAYISRFNDDIVKPAGAEIIPGAELGANICAGIMIHRNANGNGNISFADAVIRWRYSDKIRDNDRIEIAVFAIEMVYVPESPFSLGDGSFGFRKGGLTTPYIVDSEDGLTLGGTSASNLCSREQGDDDFGNTVTQELSYSFPKGYGAFYCMKYECSMGQYTAFLNKLNRQQAFGHFANTTSNGNTITNSANPDTFYTATPDRACNYTSFNDAVSYADWAGLRLMTELEYEKACRGDNFPVQGEYANGVFFNPNSSTANSSNIVNPGTEMETLNNIPSVIVSPDFGRPLRCGILAASQTSPTRINTGASYYGIMEMSGNVGEICAGVSNASQRSFSGFMYAPRYPESNSPNSQITHCTVRGGFFIDILTITDPVSQRSNNVLMRTAAQRDGFTGFRCVASGL